MEDAWKKVKESIKYERSEDYQGPVDWNSVEPASMKKNDESESEDYQGIDYEPEKIKENRKYGSQIIEYGEGDPIVISPDIEEEEEQRKNEHNKSYGPLLSDNAWKTILIIFLIVVIVYGVFYFLKNRIKNEPINPAQTNIEELNLNTIKKSELELLLEKSLIDENYRACVRIYFNFILKELIKKGCIRWKKEKTNFDYIIEMKNQENHELFEECIRVYDLIWYGEYIITKENYEEVEPIFSNYLKYLEDVK